MIDDLFGIGCAYEVYALATRRCPAITRLCRANRWLALPVLAVVLAHLTQKEVL
jgi:hypothetical protein